VVLNSLLAVAVTGALGAFMATAPFANASDKSSAAAQPSTTTTSGFSPAVREVAIHTLAAKLGISEDEAAGRIDAMAAQAQTAATLTKQLGTQAAGTYIDQSTGKLWVNVTDATAMTSVTDAGAKAKLVTRSTADLQQIMTALNSTDAMAGTSWVMNPETNTVDVQIAANTAAKPRMQRWLSKLAKYGDAVQVQQTAAGFTTQQLFGGQAILDANQTARCSAGFNATLNGQSFVITAGHCTAAVQSWVDGEGQQIGDSVVAQFPGDDFGIIGVQDAQALDQQPAVVNDNQVQPINGSNEAPVGSVVCKTGSTTGTTCGTLQATDATVTYPEGQVDGLLQTDVCTQEGDSGGALFAADQAQGMVSGGTAGDCGTQGFVSFFQPVNEVLQRTGLQLEQQ
jgi:streptogrisin D